MPILALEQAAYILLQLLLYLQMQMQKYMQKPTNTNINKQNNNIMQNIIETAANKANVKLIKFEPFECSDSNIFNHFTLIVKSNSNDNTDKFLYELEESLPNLSWAMTDDQPDDLSLYQIECALRK